MAVIIGRFVPVVRTFVPVVAGVGKMSRRTLTLLNLAGALVWAVGIVTVGFYFGGIPLVAAHIELITIAVAGVSLIPGGLELARRRRLTERPVPPAPVMAVQGAAGAGGESSCEPRS